MFYVIMAINNRLIMMVGITSCLEFLFIDYSIMAIK
ncbi:hypothetical protein AF72_05920 [Xylella taiwanensis]|uniref:Uncharacterized protein n=1 Tax=Xylella taiwanensis TaxID=1444770 RepID=Z9JKP1_9GAMM|nr:hypothetical protein AF72_05920 [Xylella taiwanensis]